MLLLSICLLVQLLHRVVAALHLALVLQSSLSWLPLCFDLHCEAVIRRGHKVLFFHLFVTFGLYFVLSLRNSLGHVKTQDTPAHLKHVVFVDVEFHSIFLDQNERPELRTIVLQPNAALGIADDCMQT